MLGLEKVQKMSGKGLEESGNLYSKLCRNPAVYTSGQLTSFSA